MEVEIKTASIWKPADMMEKIVMFLNKYWAKPETVKALIEEVSSKIEEVKTEVPEEKKEEIVAETPEVKTGSLQERLISMCK